MKFISIMTEYWKDCTNKDGTGLYFDLIRKVYPDYQIRYNIAPYKRSMYSVSVGSVDMSIGAYKDEVEGVLYPKIHFFNDETSVVFLKRTPFKGIESLIGENVLWLRGYSYDKYIDKRMVFFEQDSQKNALRLIKSGFFKYYIGPKVLIDEAKNKKDFEIRFLKWIKMYMVFANNTKGRELLALWDSNFRIFVKNGTVRKLFKKYRMEKNYRFDDK